MRFLGTNPVVGSGLLLLVLFSPASARAANAIVCFDNSDIAFQQQNKGKHYDRSLVKAVYARSVHELQANLHANKAPGVVWESADMWDWIEKVALARLGEEFAQEKKHIAGWVSYFRDGLAHPQYSQVGSYVEYSNVPLAGLASLPIPLSALEQCRLATFSEALPTESYGRRKLDTFKWRVDSTLMDHPGLDALNLAGLWLEDALRMADLPRLATDDRARSAVKELFDPREAGGPRSFKILFSIQPGQTTLHRAVEKWLREVYKTASSEVAYTHRNRAIRNPWMREARIRYNEQFEAWLATHPEWPESATKSARASMKLVLGEIFFISDGETSANPKDWPTPDSEAIRTRLARIYYVPTLAHFPVLK